MNDRKNTRNKTNANARDYNKRHLADAMKKLSDMRSAVSLACSTESVLFAEHQQSKSATGNRFIEFDEQLTATTASSSPSSVRAFKVRSASPFDGALGGGSSGQEIDTSLSRCSLPHLTHLQQLRVVPRMGTRAVVGGANRSRAIGGDTRRFGTGSRSINDGKTFQSSSSSARSFDGTTDDSVSSDSFDSEQCLVDEVEFYRRRRFSSSDREDDLDVTNKMVAANKLGGHSSSESCSSLSELYPLPSGDTNELPWPANTHRASHVDTRQNQRSRPDMKPSSTRRVRQLGSQANDEKNECRQVPSSRNNDHKRLSTTMVTNRAHLAHTILVQQRLFQQQMIAAQRRQKQQYLQQCNSHDADNKSDYWTSATFEHHYEEIEDLKSSPPSPEVTAYRAPTVSSPSSDQRWVLSSSGKLLSRASPPCSSNSIRQSRDSRDSARPIQDQQLSPGQLSNHDEKSHDLDSTDWVVKRRPDGTRYIARRSKKISPSAASRGDVTGLQPEESHLDKTLSRDNIRSRKDQPSNDSMKPVMETLRQRELRAAILELMPASEKNLAMCATDSPTIDDIGPIARSHRALLSVTTM